MEPMDKELWKVDERNVRLFTLYGLIQKARQVGDETRLQEYATEYRALGGDLSELTGSDDSSEANKNG